MNFAELMKALVDARPWTVESIQRLLHVDFKLESESTYRIDYEATDVVIGEGLTASKISLMLDGVTKFMWGISVEIAESSVRIDPDVAEKQFKSTKPTAFRASRFKEPRRHFLKIFQKWGEIIYRWKPEEPCCLDKVVLRMEPPRVKPARKPLADKMAVSDEELLSYLLETQKTVEKYLAAEQWQEANDLMWPALENLGDKYFGNPLPFDESASDVQHGVEQEGRGRLSNASNAFQNALKYRLEQFAKKVEGNHMLQNANQALQQADQFIAQKAFKEANACLDTTLKAIGDRYFWAKRRSDDPTLEQLATALEKEQSGALEDAVSLRHKALTYRRDLLKFWYVKESS